MKFKPYEEYKEVDLPWLDRMPVHWEMERNKNLLEPKNEVVGTNSGNYKLLSLTKKGIIERDMENPKGKFPSSFETYKIVEKEDIIFCLFDIDETPRTVGLTTRNGMITGAYNIFAIKGVNKKYYYYYYLYLDDFKMLKPIYTGLRKTINEDTFLRLKTPFPPKEEQDKIVDFLDENLEKIDRFIELRERQIGLLQEEKEVIINDAVTKGIDKTVDYKDSGIDWMGDIPKHWNIERVKNITELASRGVTPIYTEKRLTKVVNQATFSKGYWDISNVRYTEVSPVDCRGVLKPNDILLASTGGGVLGKVYYFTENDIYIADSHVTILRFNEKVIPKYMYYHFLVKYDFINVCLAQGATNQTEIQGGWLRSFKLPIPPLEEQKEIVAHIEKETSKIDKTIDLYKKQIDLIQEYRISLIAQAVTGKIDVRNF